MGRRVSAPWANNSFTAGCCGFSTAPALREARSTHLEKKNAGEEQERGSNFEGSAQTDGRLEIASSCGGRSASKARHEIEDAIAGRTDFGFGDIAERGHGIAIVQPATQAE